MTVADRLKELMKEKGITPQELVELCQPFCNLYNEKIDKSYVSKYLNNKVNPKLKKVTIFALALNTNEGYLLGLVSSKEPRKVGHQNIELEKVYEKLKKLDLFDLGKVDYQIDLLLKDDKYAKSADDSKVA